MKSLSAMNTLSKVLAVSLILSLVPGLVLAGGQLQIADITDFPNLPPGPTPDSFAVGLVGIHWDARCLPLDYTLNTQELPNAQPPLDVAATRQELNKALASWTDIPTSYIAMGLGGELQRARQTPFDYTVFDFINEINFISGADAPYVAISPSTSLFEDTVFAPGDDLDGDGDSDVFDPAVEGRTTCGDVDGDGDFEFPAGEYAAGTMLDNDVSFNNSIIWTTGPPDAVFGNFDLEGVAAHELGHSHGLSHSAINQISSTDGTTATMFPGVFSNDAAMQEGLRSLSTDEVAWSSFVYPEGSDTSGPAALQPGDVAFDDVFGVITGDITQGELDLPVAGASVYAVDEDSGEILVSHYSGTVQALWEPNTPFFGYRPELAAFHLIDGSYTLPVPAGDYILGVEPLDGFPVAPNAVSSTTVAGGILGVLDFNESYIQKFPRGQGSHPGQGGGLSQLKPREVKVKAGRETSAIDHTTPIEVNLDPFDTFGFGGSFDLDAIVFGTAQPGWIYAVEFPVAEIQDALDAGLFPVSASFRTFLVENSAPALFGNVSLVPGTVDGLGGAVLDLDDPFADIDDDPTQDDDVFLGQDGDFSLLYFEKPSKLARDLERAIERDGVEHVFLVVQLPDSFSGLQGLPPFIGADTGQQLGLLGRSYISLDGGATFTRFAPLNFMFRLTFG